MNPALGRRHLLPTSYLAILDTINVQGVASLTIAQYSQLVLEK
jgi:hypothetical protein